MGAAPHQRAPGRARALASPRGLPGIPGPCGPLMIRISKTNRRRVTGRVGVVIVAPLCSTGPFSVSPAWAHRSLTHTCAQATSISKRTSSSTLLFKGPAAAHSSARPGRGLLVAYGLSLLGVLSSVQRRGHLDTQELGQWLACSSSPCCRSRLPCPSQARAPGFPLRSLGNFP